MRGLGSYAAIIAFKNKFNESLEKMLDNSNKFVQETEHSTLKIKLGAEFWVNRLQTTRCCSVLNSYFKEGLFQNLDNWQTNVYASLKISLAYMYVFILKIVDHISSIMSE